MCNITSKILLLAGALGWAASGHAADKTYPGVVKASIWWGIGGTAIGDLTGNARYKEAPDEVRFFDSADMGANIGDNYGGTMEFLWTAPSSGKFHFAIAADDNAELWISTDETAANLKKVASEPQWNPARAFGDAGVSRRPGCGGTAGLPPCENVSPDLTFVGGKKYFFRGLWKEGGGGDNFAVAVAPAGEAFTDSSTVIPAEQISSVASDTASIGKATSDLSWVYVGGKVNLSVSQYLPPGGTSTLQWYKDGVSVAGATSSALAYTTVAADAGKNVRFTAKQTAAGVTTESAAATVQVIDPGPAVDSPGFLKFEAWNNISGTAVQGLLDDPRYPASPDYVSYTSSADTRPVYPDDSHENYGGKLSGYIVPTESGSYNFFLRSDDASALFLSLDDKPANLVQIAEETGCCNAFQEPGSPRTSDAVPLVGGKRYYVEVIWKEGGGGDFAQVAWRKDGDTTAAGSLSPIPGKYLLAKAPAGGVTVTFTTQPVASANVEVAKTITLSAAATAFPINSVAYQWQKDGVDIPGATSSKYTLPVGVAGDVGKTAKYRLVATTLGNVKANSSEAAVTTVADTFPPTIARAGSVKKGSNVEIGLTFNEGVDATTAGDKANYSLSAGTVSSVRFVAPKGSKLDPARVVIVASGLTAGQTVTVSAKNIKDKAGNAIPAASPATATLKVSKMSWVGVGADEINVEKGNTDYSDDVVAVGASKSFKDAEDFDLVSGGSGNWDAYDEGTFVYEEITGDFDRVVRVEYQDPTSQWARSALSVREALDEGTTRADATGGDAAVKPMSRNLNVRFSAPLQASGAGANNAYEVIDRNVPGGNYRGTPGGFGGAPNYPQAWMRISRVGKVLHFFKSDNGSTWTNEGTLDWETADQPALASKLYVGLFYSPEYNNNDTKNILTGSAISQFRDYGAWPSSPAGGGDPGKIAAAFNAAGKPSISWDSSKGGVLQSATAVNGPYADVAGATSPYVPSGAGGFYRLRGN